MTRLVMLSVLLVLGGAAIALPVTMRILVITAAVAAPCGWLRVKQPVEHWSGGFWPCFAWAFGMSFVLGATTGGNILGCAIVCAWLALLFGGAAAVLATFSVTRLD